MLIDTHTHLYSEQFNEDRTAMIERAIHAGVGKLLLPNIDADSITGMHALAQQFPGVCFPMMGIHPCSVDANWETLWNSMKPLFDEHQYVAVGEIGVDLYWDKSTEKIQKDAFAAQIEFAKDKQLPIVIHARDAFDAIYEVLDQHADERLSGVFHCFTGTEKDVEKILGYSNFYFGIGGVLTYKKSDLPEVVPHIPLDKLVLETDAPYLPPVPFRGKRNESSYILHTAEKLAEVVGLPLSELSKITSENAERLFPLIRL